MWSVNTVRCLADRPQDSLPSISWLFSWKKKPAINSRGTYLDSKGYKMGVARIACDPARVNGAIERSDRMTAFRCDEEFTNARHGRLTE